MTERLVTAKVVADHLGIPVSRIYVYAQRGAIPVALKIGSRLRFRLSDLEGWQPPQPPPRQPIRGRVIRDRWVPTKAEIATLPTTGGEVYFIQADIGGPIKIGIAVSVPARLAQLQAGCPFRLVVLATIPGGRREEAALHARFSHFRLHGEWFDETAPGLQSLIQAARAA